MNDQNQAIGLESAPATGPLRRIRAWLRGCWARARAQPIVSAAIAGLVALVVIGLTVGLFAWEQHPEPGSLGFELAKTSMQLVGITLLGAVAAIAVFALQQTVADEIKKQVEDREQGRLESRLKKEREIEQRARRDDLVRSMLGDTVAAYHGVKTARRELRALVGKSGQDPLSVDDYDRWIRSISECQLEFEELMRMAPLANDALAGLAEPSVPDKKGKYTDEVSVGGRYRAIETYLNDLVAEHRALPSQLKAAGEATIHDNKYLQKLRGFVIGEGLTSRVSPHVATLCETYRASLLRPTDIEDLGASRES